MIRGAAVINELVLISLTLCPGNDLAFLGRNSSYFSCIPFQFRQVCHIEFNFSLIEFSTMFFSIMLKRKGHPLPLLLVRYLLRTAVLDNSTWSVH
jgi:hypothetical protein